MGDWVRALVDLGVSDTAPPGEVRRIRTINVVAAFAIFFNVQYTALFAVLDFSALRFVIMTNSISIVWAGFGLYVNFRRRTDAALAVLLGAGFFNLIFAGLLLGLGTGVYLFLLALPATGVLGTRPGDWTKQLAIIGAGMAAFVAVVLADPKVPEPIADSPVETVLLVLSMTGIVTMVGVVGLYFKTIADTAEAELVAANERSERLLLNILPREIADRLKAGEEPIADRVDEVTVLFGDLVGSTALAERVSPDRLVEILNGLFTPFDDLVDELGLEKIKTVGDAYMVVAGLPRARPDHTEAIADMALAMRDELSRHSIDGGGPLQMRFGIDTGTVVAGVIGKRKFSYDLWGDTVNTAARMESHGIAGEIQVTASVFRRLGQRYLFTARGPVEIKGKGLMETYLLHGRADDAAGGS